MYESCATRQFQWAKQFPKNPQWRQVTAETAPYQKRMVQPGFEPGISPSLGGGPPQKPVNPELPEKMANTTQQRQSKKVAQRERGSDEPTRKLLGGAESPTNHLLVVLRALGVPAP